MKSLIIILVFFLAAEAQFVHVKNGRLQRGARPYHFVGTNFWQGMHLASRLSGGDRVRLLRELDILKDLKINNLRIMVGSEGPSSEPWRVTPALQETRGQYKYELLEGLDFLLVEMKKRDLTAVLCLNNFWVWSGGMAQYLGWSGVGPIPYPPPQLGGDWKSYQKYAAQFYSNSGAREAFLEFIRMIVSRRNQISGDFYINDPTIMAWQLANEPRGDWNASAFQTWIDETAKFIKELDPNHLVTTGSEGNTPWPFHNGMDFFKNHSSPYIDYTTVHIWVQNWEYYDPHNPAGTFERAVKFMKTYLGAHISESKRLGKPLVLEEFGISRDQNSYDPESSTRYRDLYYEEVFKELLQSIDNGDSLMGVNFWAWSGTAKPASPFGGFWAHGLPLVGDPPHENQGWYSVYAEDESTLKIIEKYSLKAYEASR